MNKKDLIQFCKYYKGEETNPFEGKGVELQDKAMLWFYEKEWIQLNFTNEGRELLAEYINDYSTIGLSTFEMQSNTPASLKALLFNRHAKMSNSIFDDIEPFKSFYRQYYK